MDLQDEIQKSYLDYAMSVIVGRALPDVRDGLKPVHPAILCDVRRRLSPDRGWNKCAASSARSWANTTRGDAIYGWSGSRSRG